MKELNKNNPFKTPEGYFEGFDARLNDILSKEESNIPLEDGFVVPENYFASIHSKISAKIITEETKVIPLKSYKEYYYAAASIAAVILVAFGLNWNTTTVPNFDSLAESDIENYFETNDFDLSAYEIAEVLPLDKFEINDILTTGFEEELVLDYLNENIDDFHELNLEDNE